jgi:hypothetical protein
MLVPGTYCSGLLLYPYSSFLFIFCSMNVWGDWFSLSAMRFLSYLLRIT